MPRRCGWYYTIAENIDGIPRHSMPERYCQEDAAMKVISKQNGACVGCYCGPHLGAYQNPKAYRIIPITGGFALRVKAG